MMMTFALCGNPKVNTEMDKHTPGPWEFEPSGIFFAVRPTAKGNRYGVCRVSPRLKPELGLSAADEGRANARLIAAAPDLLRALDQLAIRATEALMRLDPDNAGMWHAMTEEARAALAKAKGDLGFVQALEDVIDKAASLDHYSSQTESEERNDHPKWQEDDWAREIYRRCDEEDARDMARQLESED